MEHFPLLPAEDERRLHDPAIGENFIERIFVFGTAFSSTSARPPFRWQYEMDILVRLLKKAALVGMGAQKVLGLLHLAGRGHPNQ